MKATTKFTLACGMVALLASALAAHAQEDTWMMRVRALNMKVDNGNSPSVAGAAVSINDKTFPEIDFVYNFTKSISAELVLTYPQQHDAKLNGSKIGTLKHLPPTLLVQYQFAPGQSFNPYVGAGINYTMFMSRSLPAGVSTSSNSTGGAVQLGADIELAKNLYFNIDVKRVNIRADVTVNGAKLTTLKVDPTLLSVGLGWRF